MFHLFFSRFMSTSFVSGHSSLVRFALGLGLMSVALEPRLGWAHGASGGVDVGPGEFKMSPILTIEGHGGLHNNLDGQPRHYAIDGLVGVVLEWGFKDRGSLAIEAMIGPAFVWGEAEHFYGRVHRGHEEDHALEEAEDHAAETTGDDHHADGSTPYRRADLRGQIQVRYQPNEKVSLMAEWKPYYVTASQGEDVQGVKNELGLGLLWALGDGDVNFALGDGLETIADGLFVSVQNRTGWESEGTYIGNYTDPWIGLGFNIDRLNVILAAGPRFYSPGSYSGLSSRTDWGGEIQLALPIARRAELFAHWKPIYSTQGGEGWGVGWVHHVGTGITFRF
jgi:hypothetical protein